MLLCNNVILYVLQIAKENKFKSIQIKSNQIESTAENPT